MSDTSKPGRAKPVPDQFEMFESDPTAHLTDEQKAWKAVKLRPPSELFAHAVLPTVGDRMPRHISEAPTWRARYDEHIKALAKELKADGDGPQPLILEHVAQPGPVRYVTVIWDKLKDIPEDVRPEVITAAYEKVEGKQYADSIMTAEGVTAIEALALGLLPYGVVPARRPDDPIGPEDYRKASGEEAKRTVLGAKAKELRYARQEDAEAASKRLTNRLPGSHWAVRKQVEPPDE